MPNFFKYLQEKIVFLPVTLPENHHFDFNEKFDEYFWETPFDGKVNGLHFRVPNAKGIIVYFHGNADNLHRWGKIANEFTCFGYEVLLMDYRGFGKSTGSRNEDFLYSDAQFCYNYAKNLFEEENIVVYGRSLGGAFATYIGANNTPKAVILEAAFYNLQDMVNRWLPAQITNRVSPTMTYHFLSNENIIRINVPIYHFHGSKDFVVPLKSGKKLFKAFEKSKPKIEKKFIEIKGGRHNNLALFKEFREELKNILN